MTKDATMGKCPFFDPELQDAFVAGFVHDVSEYSRQMREQIMCPGNVLRLTHGRKWEAPANKLGDTIGEMEKHGTETSLNLRDIVEGRTDLILENVLNVASSIHDQMTGLLIGTLERSTESSGQYVDAAGRQLPEAMFELFEKMEFSLDEHGELSMPSMLIHPSQAQRVRQQLEATSPEHQERFEALKLKKKEEAQQRELTRLSRFETRNPR